jgi:hypothetical protein
VSAGEIGVAIGWFVVFGVTAVLMGRSALHDWREGRRERDGVALLSAVEQWWPAAIAAAVAVLVPIVLVVNS